MKSKFVPVIATLSLVLSVSHSQDLKPTQIYEQNSQSIVLIVTFDNEGEPIAQGSGVILPKKMVGTNCHVVAQSKFIGVQLNGKVGFAKLTASYPGSDLCVLTLNAPLGRPASLASTNEPRAGDKVYALGHPRGLELTISEGLLSGFRNTPRGRYLQISAPISHGSSGGGLFDSRGRLIGITTLSLQESQNINFAAPVDNLLKEINKVSAPAMVSSVSNHDMLAWVDRQQQKLVNVIPDEQHRKEFLFTVWYESVRVELSPDLVNALISSLSQYRKFYVAENGARGYMRILPKWSKILGDGDVGKLFHMQTNIRFGCVLLRHYVDASMGDLATGIGIFLTDVTGSHLDTSASNINIENIILSKSIK